MNRISIIITDILFRNKIIKSEEKEIYEYGIRAFFTNMISTIAMFFLGILLKEFLFTLSYYICIKILRSIYGSFHMNTRIKCFICTINFYLLSMVIVKLYFCNFKLLYLVCILAFFVFLLNKVKFKHSHNSVNLKNNIKLFLKPVIIELIFIFFYLIDFKVVSYGILASFLTVVLLESFMYCLPSKYIKL